MRSGKVLKAAISRTGYERITFGLDKKKKDIRVHRAVYEAWWGELGTLQVNHIDGNKRNNSPANLEAVTPLENSRHAVETGLYPTGDRHWTHRCPGRFRGEDIGTSKLTEPGVREIRRRRASGELLSSIAKDFGVGETLVSMVARRKIWKHVV
jgi:hypothetical protein